MVAIDTADFFGRSCAEFFLILLRRWRRFYFSLNENVIYYVTNFFSLSFTLSLHISPSDHASRRVAFIFRRLSYSTSKESNHERSTSMSFWFWIGDEWRRWQRGRIGSMLFERWMHASVSAKTLCDSDCSTFVRVCTVLLWCCGFSLLHLKRHDGGHNEKSSEKGKHIEMKIKVKLMLKSQR